MHEYTQLDGGSALGVEARVDAVQWETGEPGVSTLRLDLLFTSVPPGTRWFVVASGDYATDPTVPDSFFCSGPGGHRVDGGYECPGSDYFPAMRYDFRQELGFWGGMPHVNSGVVDLNGYDARSVTVVSGRVPAPDNYTGESVVDVWLPISTPPTTAISGKTFMQYGRIGFEDWEWGAGGPLDASCDLGEDAAPDVVLMPTCVPLRRVEVSSTTFDGGFEMGLNAVAYSSPNVVSNDQVVWNVDGPFPGGRVLVTNPFAEDRATWNSFFAGVLLSISVAALFLLVDEALKGRRRTTSGL